MKQEDRINRYKEIIEWYKGRPDGLEWSDLSEKKIFIGICDLLDGNKEDFPELSKTKPNNYGLFWWPQSKGGVKTRIKKLNIMIEMAKKATE